MSAEGRVEHQLISVPCDEVYRVRDGGPDHAVVPHMLLHKSNQGTS